jgi:hypothetical protein
MKKEVWILRMLNIRAEEAKAVFLLMGFSFFIGLSLTFYFTASNALFLKHFQAGMIPVSFIASGVLIYLAWLIFSRIDKKLPFPRQVLIKFLFIFITVLAISLGVRVYDLPWLTFIMYTWVRILVYITLVNFWGMAGKLFNIRQGKRIFGLIGIGEVISIMIGYFSIPLLLQFMKASDLLFLASGSLFLCLIMVIILFRTFKDQMQGIPAPVSKEMKAAKSEWNYWNLIRKPYFLLISLMALLPIFGYLFVDFLFLAQTKREFANNPETIAKFLGVFLGIVAVAELVFKLFSGRFLDRYGLKPSLASLPVLLTFGIILAAISGTIYGAEGLFFAFIAFARMFERAVRGAIYEPAFQLLYQPVPNEQRLIFQNQIEGIPKALGTVITGALILLLSGFQVFSLVHFNYFFLLVLGAWIWLSFKMYEEYRNLLKVKISEIRHTLLKSNESEITVIERTITTSSPDGFDRLTGILEKVAPASFGEALDRSLQSAPGTLQEKIREKKEQTTKEIREAGGYPFSFLIHLAHSADPETREQAARLLGYSGRYNTYKILIQLLKDPVRKVKKAALISSGRIRRYELWPILMENLVSPDYGNAASIAVRMIGEPILSELDHHFDKIAGHTLAQIRIIRIYESVGGEKAVKLLRNKISYPDMDVRYQVMLSLSNMEYHASLSEIPYINQTIEESAETMVWIMAALTDVGGSVGTMTLQNALLQELEEKKENIFHLLSLLYDSATIRHIRETIESQDAKARIYALEICDMTFSDEIKDLFLPLFEDIPIAERMHRFRFRFPQEKLSTPERISEIVNKACTSVNRWTRACALHLLGQQTHQPGDLADTILSAHLVNPDPLLSEIAAWMLYNRNKTYYFNTLSRFEKNGDQRIALIRETTKNREKAPGILLFEEILKLKETPLFAPVPEVTLVPLAMELQHTGATTAGEDMLIDFMTGDLTLIERYLNLSALENAKK